MLWDDLSSHLGPPAFHAGAAVIRWPCPAPLSQYLIQLFELGTIYDNNASQYFPLWLFPSFRAVVLNLGTKLLN